MALANPRLGADNLGQKRLGSRISMENIILAALFIIDNKLHRDTGVTRAINIRPFGVWRGGTMAKHIAWILCHLDRP
jgi:hypothetical protein